MTWFLDLRVQSSGGGVAREPMPYRDQTLVPVTELQAAILNRDVLIVTHGFNVNGADGRTSLGYWEEWLSLPVGTVYIAVLWPGDSAWVPAVDYPIEGNEAIASGNLLASYIATNLGAAASFSFASHSLGARVVLQTIQRLGSTARVRRLMLMAGAIDDNCLSVEYKDAAQVPESISVLSSYHDEVLALAFPLGNFFAGLISRGSPYWHAALGREGPDSVLGGKVQEGWQIPNPWKYGHHNYLAHDAPQGAPPPLPQAVPPLTAAVPGWATFDEWQAAWSGAILGTRWV